LTDAQVQSVQAIRNGTFLSDGTLVYAGFGLGAEDVAPNNWSLYITSGAPSFPAPADFLLVYTLLQDFVFNDPTYSSTSFNIDRDYPIALQVQTNNGAQLISATLAPYAAAGKKMITWQGESDYSVSTSATVNFYDLGAGMLRRTGPRKACSEASSDPLGGGRPPARRDPVSATHARRDRARGCARNAGRQCVRAGMARR
jgi:hypothetical protein